MFKLLKSFYKTQQVSQPSFIESQANMTFIPILKAEALLNTKEYQQQLREIKQQISTTPEDYQQKYLPLIHNVAEFMQQLPSRESETDNHQNLFKTLLSISLTQAINALKVRRGYMLPIGADTETCYQQQSSWTYGVLVASLLQESWQIMACHTIHIYDKQHNLLGRWHPLIVPKLPVGHFYQQSFKTITQEQRSFSVLLAKMLIPESGFQWLCENESLTACLLAHLNGNTDHHNPLTLIIQQAKNKQHIENPSSLSITATEIKKIGTIADIQEKVLVESTQEKKEVPYQESTNARVDQPVPDQSNQINIQPQLQAKHKEINTASHVSTSCLEQKDIANTFLQWLKQKIQSIRTVNDESGILYRVEHGILIVMPKALLLFQHDFAGVKNIAEKTFIKILTDAGLIILDAEKKTSIHHYFKGAWQTRETIQGILLKSEHLPDEKEQLPLCTDLQPYPF